MTIDNSISEMNRLMNIINGTSSESPNTSTGQTGVMKKILEAFYSVSDDAIKSGKQIKELNDAYLTEETATGVKIGAWYIDCVKEGRVRNSYHIREENSYEYLITDLSLYEAAYALVKVLRANENISSRKVQNILRLEADYSKSLNDAIIHKHTLNSKNLSETRRAVLEDRYEASKYNAAVAKRRIEESV